MERLNEREALKLGKVMLITSEGDNLGEVDVEKALDMAYEADLDLVLLKKDKVSVCKIMDYSKHMFDKKKKEKQNSKGSKVRLKEVQLSLNIGDHDLKVKAKTALRNIDKGHKVKVVLVLRGREMDHKHLGFDLLNKFKDVCGEDVSIDKDIHQEGNKLLLLLS